jgi:DNA-binding XRE family transcriptional regulator/mannose-6-phosphate isomerase-like protein (cupin superfamily)
LSSNHVGPRLRERREALGVSLRQFARELDVSASFLSQLETGKAQPSVATLYSICDALNISVDDLFTSESSNLDGLEVMAAHSRMGATLGVHVNSASGNDTGFQWLRPNFGDGHSPVVTPADRKVIALDSGVTWERLTATTGAQSNFLFVRYDVGGSSTDGNLIRHLGTEYWYVMSGTLEVVLGFETYRLNAGDAISFDSSTPHRLSNGGDVSVEAIWFNLDHHVPIA